MSLDFGRIAVKRFGNVKDKLAGFPNIGRIVARWTKSFSACAAR
jgi:hypothetical protein